MGLKYTKDDLFRLYSTDVTPARAVRKAIFSHNLWLPSYARANLRRRLLRWRAKPAVFTCVHQTADRRHGGVPAEPRRQRKPLLTSVSFGLLNAQSITKKTTSISSVIVEDEFDVFLINETWHSSSDDVALRRCTPPGYHCIDTPRPTPTPGGGVAAIISDRLSTRVIKLPVTVETFESVCFSIHGAGSTVVVLLVYRPGSATVTSQFFTDLESVLEVVALYKCQVLIAGDFNVHVERDDRHASALHDILNSFDCVQHVPHEPTHRCGGTLDLVITKSEQSLDAMAVDPPGALSDHSLVHWSLPLLHQPPITTSREVRGWRKLDTDKFRSALLASSLCDNSCVSDEPGELFQMYEDVLRSLTDTFVPARTVTTRRQRFAAWMDSECRLLRRNSRRLERKYRRTGTASDRLAWVEHERKRHKVYRQKERAFWNAQLVDHARQPKKLWNTLSSILGSSNSKQLPKNTPSAQDFLDFFNKKVEAVREATGQGPAATFLPPATSTLIGFQPYAESDVAKVITAAPSKSCELDPIPTDILKQFLPELLPFITRMCNTSLRVGILPTSQRSAVVTPRLKKAGSDQADVQNYRPISNLTFMSKVVERLVCRQLVAYLEQNGLLPELQSAYRRGRSTETAIVKVVADFLSAADRGDVTFLSLLDLSAAFDTVDHDILITRLHDSFGIRDTALSWISSFITGRTQRVRVGSQYSTDSAVYYGVPQGSVLGPVLFLLYTADVLVIAARHGVGAHSYADDTQLYVHSSPDNCQAIFARLMSCMDDVGHWMSSNRLKLNTGKTQFTCLGTRYQLAKIDASVLVANGSAVDLLCTVTCLGVTIDQRLTFGNHIKRITGRCFHCLRQLRSIRRTLTTDTAIALVNSLVISRIDYCNAVLTGVYGIHCQQFHGVLNAAARLIARKRKFDSISSTIRDFLHWLPIPQRIEYKLCTLMFNCLHGIAPVYLSTMCQPVSANLGRRPLRSAARGDLAVPATRTVHYGPRSFAVAGPSTWNSLPASLRDHSLTYTSFCRQLKTFLFGRAYHSSARS